MASFASVGTYNAGGTVTDWRAVAFEPSAPDGPYLYAVSSNSQKIYVLDVSNPAAVTLVGVSPLARHFPVDVDVVGDYAYVANNIDFSNGALDIFDVNPGSTPTVVGTLGPSNYLTGVNRVIVRGTTAWCACQAASVSARIVAVDVTNPAAPATAGAHLLVSGINNGFCIHPTAALAFLTSIGADRVSVVDISTTTPSLVTHFVDAVNLDGARHCWVDPTTGYLIVGCDAKVTAVDISTPSAPAIADVLPLGSSGQRLTFAEPSGLYAFGVLDGTDDYYAVDVSDPLDLSLSFSTLNLLAHTTNYLVPSYGNGHLFVPSSGGVRIIEVDPPPVGPVIIGTFALVGLH